MAPRVPGLGNAMAEHPSAVIRLEPGEWHPRMPERLDEEERAGRDAVYQLAALTVGSCLAVAGG